MNNTTVSSFNTISMLDAAVASKPASTDTSLVNSEMAGYIDALFAYLSDSKYGSTAPLLPGALQAGSIPLNPDHSLNASQFNFSSSAVQALEQVMSMIGNPNFATALQQEYTSQSGLKKVNSNFMGSDGTGQTSGLYFDLTNEGILSDPTNPNSAKKSILEICQDYVKNGGPTFNTAVTTDIAALGYALNTNQLNDFIENIGSSTNGYNIKVLPYKPDNTRFETALEKGLSQLTTDIASNNAAAVIADIKNIESLPDQYGGAAVANDPNYLLVMNMFQNNFGLNPGGAVLDATGKPIKDTSGNEVYAYSIASFATLDPTKFSATDYQTLMTAMMSSFNASEDRGSIQTSWTQMINDLNAYITKY